MTKLITGGTGFIGAQLARILVEQGEDLVLFDIAINHNRIEDIEKKVKVVQGSLYNYSEVLNVVKDNHIQGIYHLGSMLSVPSNLNPWANFQTNVIGTYNVLEAARIFEVERIVFTSTIGTYGLEAGDVITDTTIQRPLTMYGIGKLYCEGLGRFYRNKFGLDFRAIRYPTAIGPGATTPAATQWVTWMIESAILGKPFECPATEEALTPTIYLKDCARAARLVYENPKENIKMVIYNVAGVTPGMTAGELARALHKHYPAFQVTFNPAPPIGRIMGVKKFDDTTARQELGWKSEFSQFDMMLADFDKELKEHPHRYGLLLNRS